MGPGEPGVDARGLRLIAHRSTGHRDEINVAAGRASASHPGGEPQPLSAYPPAEALSAWSAGDGPSAWPGIEQIGSIARIGSTARAGCGDGTPPGPWEPSGPPPAGGIAPTGQRGNRNTDRCAWEFLRCWSAGPEGYGGRESRGRDRHRRLTDGEWSPARPDPISELHATETTGERTASGGIERLGPVEVGDSPPLPAPGNRRHRGLTHSAAQPLNRWQSSAGGDADHHAHHA
jgi:hypothetical protein